MRNPNAKWTSEYGRVVQVGDSAHPFLPTSANGATQALEDAITLATCLRVSDTGPEGVPMVCRIYNKLR
jgi:2-polyprenyl-6-methoxyphenol hydroxylase-like FAD-dependent oxidoreductase